MRLTEHCFCVSGHAGAGRIWRAHFVAGDDLAIDQAGPGAAATISSAPAGTFLRCRAFFLAVSQEVV
jgi:hypothetical protein